MEGRRPPTRAALAIGGSSAVGMQVPKGALASGGLRRRWTIRPSLIRRWKNSFIDDADYDAFVQRLEERTPLGFKNREEVVKVVSDMQTKLQAVAFDQVKIVMRGSAATGRRFESGRYSGPAFDGEDVSDYDFALISETLFKEAEKWARALKTPNFIQGNGTRTRKVPAEVLEKLELKGLLPTGTGRSSSVVIYRDMRSLENRGPYIPMD